MNTKLIEKIKRSAIKGRLGDFICNFIAVVLVLQSHSWEVI